MDPTELWTKWYETGSRVWSDALRGTQESYVDPYGIYRQWFDNLEDVRDRMTGAAFGGMERAGEAASGDSKGSMDVQNMVGRWFDATAESWQKAAGLGMQMAGLYPRWMQMLEQTRQNMMSAESLPKDPLEFAVQWYNATSGPFSEFVQDVIEREEFLEPSSRFLQSYAKFYKVFRRNSEDYLRNLQLPVRSDITRVASLIVALEEKVDRIEEAFEDFEYGYAEPATAESVAAVEERIGRLERALERVGEGSRSAATAESVEALENRLDGVEGKLDRLISAVESLQGAAATNGSAGAAAETGGQTGEQPEIRATDAARRKARELNVDLADVRGTGSNGQITVEDVRKRGES
jgi:hypothetical protein